MELCAAKQPISSFDESTLLNSSAQTFLPFPFFTITSYILLAPLGALRPLMGKSENHGFQEKIAKLDIQSE